MSVIKNTKKAYQAPLLAVSECHTESGFALTGATTESYGSETGWGSDAFFGNSFTEGYGHEDWSGAF